MANPPIEVIRENELYNALQRQIRQQAEWLSLPTAGTQQTFDGRDFWILPGVFPPGDDTYQLARNLGTVTNKNILDYGTGTGAIAVYAASRNAAHVHATDINPFSIKNARMNAVLWGLESKITFQVTDGLDHVSNKIHFDIIAANLPGRNLESRDNVQAAHWDTNFKAHKSLFRNAHHLLSENGVIFVAKANYPELYELISLSEVFGFKHNIIDVDSPFNNDPRRSYIITFSLNS